MSGIGPSCHALVETYVLRGSLSVKMSSEVPTSIKLFGRVDCIMILLLVLQSERLVTACVDVQCVVTVEGLVGRVLRLR